jgi:hypothetical protein
LNPTFDLDSQSSSSHSIEKGSVSRNGRSRAESIVLEPIPEIDEPSASQNGNSFIDKSQASCGSELSLPDDMEEPPEEKPRTEHEGLS